MQHLYFVHIINQTQIKRLFEHIINRQLLVINSFKQTRTTQHACTLLQLCINENQGNAKLCPLYFQWVQFDDKLRWLFFMGFVTFAVHIEVVLLVLLLKTCIHPSTWHMLKNLSEMTPMLTAQVWKCTTVQCIITW